MNGIESVAKAAILTSGLVFSPTALTVCRDLGAKGQNDVYNRPIASDLFRPQELFLTGNDRYTTCVSCVAPVPGRTPVRVDVNSDGGLELSWKSHEKSFSNVHVLPVPEPQYYSKKTASGRPVKRIASACGYDELNIWPWHDCAISSTCRFCGINAVHKSSEDRDVDVSWARRRPESKQSQLVEEETVVREVGSAIRCAADDPCYSEHLHVIIISGNFANHALDEQAHLYSSIARAIPRSIRSRSPEGITAITAPPNDLGLIEEMHEAGIDTIAFNLEIWNPKLFDEICPGKSSVGRDHYLRALTEAVNVFGHGRSWSNFVLGLEPIDQILSGAEELASAGICPGANVYHLDHGAARRWNPPSFNQVLDFYRELSTIYSKYKLKPYYCEKALRTSLANEAYHQRI